LPSDALMAIAKRYHLSDATISGVERTIDFLQPSDILTKVGLARRVNMDADFAEKILFDMVNSGLLGLVIRVDCSNEEGPHTLFFNSLKDYAEFMKRPCREYGMEKNSSSARVGFRMIPLESSIDG